MAGRIWKQSARHALAIGAVAALGACGGDSTGVSENYVKAASSDAGTAAKSQFRRTDLVSDQAACDAPFIDSNLVNPWGIAYGPDTYFWVANAGTGTSTVYDGSGRPQPKGAPLIVQFPAPPSAPTLLASDDAGAGQGADAGAEEENTAPTGMAYYGGSGFVLKSGNRSGASRFLFATEQGTILGYRKEVDAKNALLLLNNSASDASYKGLAVARRGKDDLLYVTNFRAGTVEVYDGKLKRAAGLATNAFRDSGLPAGYAPFGIHVIGNRLFVTFVQQDAAKEDEVAGAGKGYVDEFDVTGRLIRRVASGGRLNAPWAVVRAPSKFGDFGGALLIGNFGDGRITAYDFNTRAELGQLEGTQGDPLEIDGLWDLVVGNGRLAGDKSTLYFSAGVDDEAHGAFGSIELAQ